ncbi:MAG: Trk system potassium transporter TrkA [Acidobacteriota bacterium]
MMRATIVGAGEVGFHIADRLAREGLSVTVIEQDADREAELRSSLNALVLNGSGASPSTLEDARTQEADLFIAVTDLDEVNLISCLLARELGVPRTIARVRSLESDRPSSKLSTSRLGIDVMINPQEVVAEEICRLVSHGSATGVVEFAGGRVLVLGYPVGEDSPLAGVQLRELGEMRGLLYRLVITALVRGDQTLVPRGDDEIQPGDTVYFACNQDELPAVRYLFGLDPDATPKRVFILGGGRVGRQLARKLAARKLQVTIIDRNLSTCEAMARELEDIQVLRAEGTDLATLEAEGLGQADVFVAVTQDDKANILCALLARKAGAQRVICLVDQPELVGLTPSLGIDARVSPRLATAAAVLQHVRGGAVASMAMLETGGAEILEFVIPEGNPHLGQALKTLRVPDDSIVAAIVRHDDVIVPSGDDHLEVDDHVVIFALPEAVARLQRFFGSGS